MWEMYFENEPAAMNDLVNTTLGGMAHGEIQHRVANMILDNTASGFDRLLREVGSLVLNRWEASTGSSRARCGTTPRILLDASPAGSTSSWTACYGHRIGSNAGDADKVQGASRS